MKILIDQNLSFKLLEHLCIHFPNSLHVKDIGFEAAGDEVIWSYAKKIATLLINSLELIHDFASNQEESMLILE